MVNSVVLNVTFDQDILALSQHHLALHQHPTLACGNNRLRQQARTDKLIIQDRSRQPPIDVYGSIKPVFKDVYLDVLYQSVYLRWMQCASLLNTIKPSLRKQRRKGYLFSTNLCFMPMFTGMQNYIWCTFWRISKLLVQADVWVPLSLRLHPANSIVTLFI